MKYVKKKRLAKLNEPMKKKEICKVEELLNQGADPNYLIKDIKFMIKSSTKNGQSEIFKLLVKHGTNLEKVKSRSSQEFKYLSTRIVDYIKDVKNFFMIFQELINSKTLSEQSSIEIFKHLLDRGLPVENLVVSKNYTPLHLSIIKKKINFVSLLIKRGADVNKKTLNGKTPLCLAVQYGDEAMVQLLLKKGALVNEKSFRGMTALHIATKYDLPRIMSILLKQGADTNILDDNGNTPVTCATFNVYHLKSCLVKELALRKFEGQLVCDQNMDWLKSGANCRYRSPTFFRRCLKELGIMKKTSVYKNYSLYDILKMRTNLNKLFFLVKNEKFYRAFKIASKVKISAKIYDVKNIFDVVLQAIEKLKPEEDKLESIFKNHLPSVPIRKIANYIIQDLYLE